MPLAASLITFPPCHIATISSRSFSLLFKHLLIELMLFIVVEVFLLRPSLFRVSSSLNRSLILLSSLNGTSASLCNHLASPSEVPKRILVALSVHSGDLFIFPNRDLRVIIISDFECWSLNCSCTPHCVIKRRSTLMFSLWSTFLILPHLSWLYALCVW